MGNAFTSSRNEGSLIPSQQRRAGVPQHLGLCCHPKKLHCCCPVMRSQGVSWGFHVQKDEAFPFKYAEGVAFSSRSFFIKSLTVSLPEFLLICTGGRERRIIFYLLHAKFYTVHRLAQRGARKAAEKKGFSRLKLMGKGSVNMEDKGELTKTCAWET